MQWVIRFLIGGTMVSAFALLGDTVKPKGFAGLFGAVPSVALASLALTVYLHGSDYAAVQARSMILGAMAFCLYALACMAAMSRLRWHARSATLSLLMIWAVAAFALLEAAKTLWF